jgi:hypothetical protein
MKAQFVAGIVTPKSNYVLMPDGSFGHPRRYKSAWQFADKAVASAELAKHLPAFAKSERKRTHEPFVNNGEFFATHSEFELTVDQINARQAKKVGT